VIQRIPIPLPEEWPFLWFLIQTIPLNGRFIPFSLPHYSIHWPIGLIWGNIDTGNLLFFLTLIDPSFSSDPSSPPKKGVCLKMGIPFVLWRFKNSRDLEVPEVDFQPPIPRVLAPVPEMGCASFGGPGDARESGDGNQEAYLGGTSLWLLDDKCPTWIQDRLTIQELLIGVSTQAVRLQVGSQVERRMAIRIAWV